MLSTVRNLLLGSGRLPERVRETLEAEGLVLLEEGLRGSVTYKRYRAPGKRFYWKRSAITAAVALTTRRVVLHTRGGAAVDVPYDHPAMRDLEVRAEDRERLLLSYDAAAFHADRSGTVELRLRTPRAAEIAAELERRAPRVAATAERGRS